MYLVTKVDRWFFYTKFIDRGVEVLETRLGSFLRNSNRGEIDDSTQHLNNTAIDDTILSMSDIYISWSKYVLRT